ncbi:MAG TPA: hypothetical protein VIO11_04470, partial [Candidatus Methanoperedens sp.]
MILAHNTNNPPRSGEMFFPTLGLVGEKDESGKKMYISIKKPQNKSVYFIFIIAPIFLFQFHIMPVSALPAVGDSFEYTIFRNVGSGTGEYSGYSDELRSDGKYDVTSLNSTYIQFHANYSWTYHNSEGLNQAGSEDRIASFSSKTRLYAT